MPNKPILRALIIGGFIIALVAIIGAFTFLNKRWWAHRIEARWPAAKGIADNAELLAGTSLKRMMQLYADGGGVIEGPSTDGTQAAPLIT